MTATITIDRRFNGPSGSANGGYTAGSLARFIDGPAVVTLRVPPPLEVAMDVVTVPRGVELRHGDTLVAEAQPTSVDVEPPGTVDVETAAAATAGYPWRYDHIYPTCFTCGPERGAGDGLRIFPGPVPGGAFIAAPWTPYPRDTDEAGNVRDEVVWAALDCPSCAMLDPDPPVLLGRIAADLRAPVRGGESHVAVAWELGEEGRKAYTASALFTANGELRGLAQATWIRLR